MKIKIEIDDELKSFETIKLKGRVFRRLLELQETLEEAGNSIKVEHLDLILEFMVECFDHEFTTDELLDGLALEDIFAKFAELAREINTKTSKKMDNISKK